MSHRLRALAAQVTDGSILRTMGFPSCWIGALPHAKNRVETLFLTLHHGLAVRVQTHRSPCPGLSPAP